MFMTICKRQKKKQLGLSVILSSLDPKVQDQETTTAVTSMIVLLCFCLHL